MRGDVVALACGALAGLVVAAAEVSCVGGGCGFTDASDVTISPGQSCLDLRIAIDEDDPDKTRGCVIPVLAGDNGCHETLVFEADDAGAWGALAVPPGGHVHVEIGGMGAHDDPATPSFEIPARLGDADIVVHFTVFAEQ